MTGLANVSLPTRETLAPLAYDITGKSTLESFVGTCASTSFNYTIRATSSTTSSPSSYYLAAQTSLTVANVFRGKRPETVPTTPNGPTSSKTASFSYSYPCSRPGDRASVSGWHKGRQTSTSTAVFKTSRYN
jgi:hypothetical protein